MPENKQHIFKYIINSLQLKLNLFCIFINEFCDEYFNLMFKMHNTFLCVDNPKQFHTRKSRIFPNLCVCSTTVRVCLCV